jgi:hypothetical protein
MILYSVIILSCTSLSVFFFAKPIQFQKVPYYQKFLNTTIRIKILTFIACCRIASKLLLGGMSITHVPTYQDDAFGNRNYRTKVFFYRESLVLDNNDKDFL